MDKVYVYTFKDSDYDCEDYYLVTNCDCKEKLKRIESNFDFDYETFLENAYDNDEFLYNYLKENKNVNLENVYEFEKEFLDHYNWLMRYEQYTFYY